MPPTGTWLAETLMAMFTSRAETFSRVADWVRLVDGLLIRPAPGLTEKLAAKIGLPAYEYVTDNVTKVGPSGYVYARNLMATRLYACPVVYLEPYVMNSREVFARVQAVKAKGGTVTREAGPVKGGSTVIAFVADPDGYKLELIETTRR